MKDRDLRYFGEAIAARLNELRDLTATSAQSRETVELDQQSVGRLSRMDAIERKAMADATHRLRHLEIQQLAAASKRLDSGDFGYCVDCGDEIERERLMSNLTVVKCFDCVRG
jgi:DnaK suppressor protein